MVGGVVVRARESLARTAKCLAGGGLAHLAARLLRGAAVLWLGTADRGEVGRAPSRHAGLARRALLERALYHLVDLVRAVLDVLGPRLAARRPPRGLGRVEPHAGVDGQWRWRPLLAGDQLGRALRLGLQLRAARIVGSDPLVVPLGEVSTRNVLRLQKVGDDAQLDHIDVREEVVPELSLGQLRPLLVDQAVEGALQVRMELAVTQRRDGQSDLVRLQLLVRSYI